VDWKIVKSVEYNGGVKMKEFQASKLCPLGQYTWSDNWCVDGDKIWFMLGNADILFQMDAETKHVKMVSPIPTRGIVGFRQHPIILKNDDVIYCLPDCGEDIWCYHITEKIWTRISVENTSHVRLCVDVAWIINGSMYMISRGSKQVIEVDIVQHKVSRYYNIANKGMLSGEGILVGNSIYIVGVDVAVIYKFNVDSKKMQKIDLPEIGECLFTISHDGEKFWLSGQSLKIYRWNEEENSVTIIDDFPSDFWLYNLQGNSKLVNYHQEFADGNLFIHSVYVGDKLWFIPLHWTNQILYIEKNTMKINVFHIDNELQDEKSVKDQLLPYKYLFEYVRDDRYIGIFSLKNKWFFEIDSQTMTYKVLDCILDESEALNIGKRLMPVLCKDGYIISETKFGDLNFFLKCLA
jgi:hypothetical protein